VELVTGAASSQYIHKVIRRLLQELVIAKVFGRSKIVREVLCAFNVRISIQHTFLNMRHTMG